MRHPLALASILALSLAAAAPTAAAKGWESLKTPRPDAVTVVSENEIEIKTVRGAILITVTQPTQIKVFTILGQLVSNHTLQPGTSMLPLQAHGIYIIKTGDLTCKVAV